MDTALAAITASLAEINKKLDRLPQLETAMAELKADNVTLRTELQKRDATIEKLQDQLNRCDQATRSTSMRIVGLPISSTTLQHEIPEIVYQKIIRPIIEHAISKDELPPTAIPFTHLIIDSAFSIQSKKNTAATVIVKLSSQFIRTLIFRHKQDALPKKRNITLNKDQCIYGIFDDLAPTNYQHLRSLADDSRVKSAWSFNGQIRCRLHNSEDILKVRSLSDTVDSLIKNKKKQGRTTTTPDRIDID